MVRFLRYIASFWRSNKSGRFIRLLSRSLKGSLIHFWINMQPALSILKDELLRTAKQFWRTFQLVIKEIIKKGLTKLIEVIYKHILKNERVLNSISFYLSLVLILLALVLLKKILTRKWSPNRLFFFHNSEIERNNS